MTTNSNIRENRRLIQRKSYYKSKGFPEGEAMLLASKGGRKRETTLSNNKNVDEISCNLKSNSYVLIMLMLGASLTFILVISSLDFFGKTPEGILKAIALECGILALVAYKATSFLQNISRIVCLTAAITLSVSVLHVGAKQSSTERQAVLASIEKNMSNIEERRKELLATVNSLPDSHTTNKRRMLSEIAAADQSLMELSEKKASLLMSSSIFNVSLSEMTDTFVRIVFLIMNMYFTHLLAAKLRTQQHELKEAPSFMTVVMEKSKRLTQLVTLPVEVIVRGLNLNSEGKLTDSRAIKT